MRGGSYFAFVCVSVCLSMCKTTWKNTEPVNFIFGGGLPSDPGRKPFDFEKYRPGVRMGVGGPKFGPNDKR